MLRNNLVLLFVCFLGSTIAQNSLKVFEKPGEDISGYKISGIQLDNATTKIRSTRLQSSAITPSTIQLSMTEAGNYLSVQDLSTSRESSLWLRGEVLSSSKARSTAKSELRSSFTRQALKTHGVEQDLELVVTRAETRQGVHHTHLQHQLGGIPVWGSELTLHEKGSNYSLTGVLKGINYSSYPEPVLNKEDATSIVTGDLKRHDIYQMSEEKKQEYQHILEEDQHKLVLYETEKGLEPVWYIQSHPNLSTRIEYFVSAIDGRIVKSYDSICKLHDHEGTFNGPSQGSGIDLHGEIHQLQTWEVQGTQFLIDGSRPDMFDNRSIMPDQPLGVIVTYDAINTYPGNENDFRFRDIVSTSNIWDNPIAVSAHNNAATVYEYFKDNFAFISVDGKGGNITSYVNVVDELNRNMDNAFWSGKAIYYGNGNVGFSAPLAKGLDVAAHELSHGVIQHTANLTYYGESGAINESFADVFAVLIDREDWLIGEDIVNPSFFRSGALRSVSDPTQQLGSNDKGWQPDHYDIRFIGTKDRGGVHINSGIPNRAFFLFASQVGREVAERVYFTVLANYLTRSSQFVDLKIAVIDASRTLYNAQVADAARSAFDAVGIIGESEGEYTKDLEINPGLDFILAVDEDLSAVNIVDNQGNALTTTPIITSGVTSPLSVTDDGSLVVYSDGNRRIRSLEIDWNTGDILPGPISEDNPIWHNVAISRDGLKLAATTQERNDSIYVFDLLRGSFVIYELTNPTTADGVDISTGDVEFSDALEWDHTGEFLLYDAFNKIDKLSSDAAITYWDIGFIRVWDNDIDDYGDGFITKLFSGLGEGVSVGNPTFAKNSPYIISFDLLQDDEQGETMYLIAGVNIETGDLGLMYENNRPGYPSFSNADDQIIFDTEASGLFSSNTVIARISIDDSKISGVGDPSIFRDFSRWGEWFSNGSRDLSTPTLEIDGESRALTVYPNPSASMISIRADWLKPTDHLQCRILGVDGTVHLTENIHGVDQEFQLDIRSLSSGSYMMTVEISGEEVSFPIIKLE